MRRPLAKKLGPQKRGTMASPEISPQFEFNTMYVRSLRLGDPSIEEHFVSHFNPILLRKLRGKLRSADLAHDLRQETFLRVLDVLRSDQGVRHPERLEVFVLGVCNNVLRETYRQQKPLVQLQPEFDLASNQPGPYACALAAETGSNVHKVLSRLPPNARAILNAVFLEEQDRDEICRRFGINRTYLRLLVYRAKKEFSALAQKEMQGKTGLRALRSGWSRRRRAKELKPRPVLPRNTALSPAPIFQPA
jgi:RNA polymerase sigma-70 factor (ECF subfamily)